MAYNELAMNRPVSLADLSLGVPRIVLTRLQTRERGEQEMRFSGRPDPLTEAEMAKLNTFYEKVLKDGFASWPLDRMKVQLYIDGTPRKIYYDTRWATGDEYIYIGGSKDEGSGEFASPAARLACVTALMGITGHFSKPTLIALLSERLAKIMAGVYDSVVKPLAITADSKPVRRMAWSASGGLVSWCDGEWVGLTGEPVVVGSDWIVVDTNEGPVEDGLPAVGAVGPATNSVQTRTAREEFEEAAQGGGTARMPDGRTRTNLTYPERETMESLEPPPLTHAHWVEIKERFDLWASHWFSNCTPDGRRSVCFGGDQECLENKILEEGLTGCVVEMDTQNRLAITYPPEPLQRNVSPGGYD
jgi:hypothetical protein